MINQIPRTLFSLEGIQDPAVRDNFDRLNRELQRQQTSKQPASANFRRGETLSSPSTGGNGPFSVTITTRGNPVTVKLEAAQSTLVSLTTNEQSYFEMRSGSAIPPVDSNVASLAYVLKRKTDQGEFTVAQFLHQIRVGSLTVPVVGSVVRDFLQLPLFSYTDDNGGLGLPAGTYTYSIPTFDTSITSPATVIQYNKLSLTAYELGG